MKITQDGLQDKVNELNKLTGSPAKPYDHDLQKFNVGSFYLSYRFDGVALFRISKENGSFYDVFEEGYSTKRVLYSKIYALIIGYKMGRL